MTGIAPVAASGPRAGGGRSWARAAGGVAAHTCIAGLLVLVPYLADRSRILDLGEAYRFAWPWVLLGLVAPAAILVWRLRRPRRTVPRWRWPLAPGAGAAPRSARVLFHLAPATIRAAALGLCVLALARPQGTRGLFEATSEGIDIVLALDMSGSMAEPDMFPSRFEAEKGVVRSFIAERENDRIGVVVFGSEAYPLSPVTADRAMLDSTLESLELEHMPETMQNTAIGDALVSAIGRLLESDAASRVIILLTDGMDNESDVDPRDAAREAAEKNMRVYTILMGVQGEVVPPQGLDARGRPIFMGPARRFPTDPGLLRDIASATGGAFFEATHKAELEGAFHRILDELRKTERRSHVVLANERFEFFLILGAILLGIEFVLRQFWLREFA